MLLLGFAYPGALLDGRTYRLLGFIHQPSQAVWSNVQPDLLIGTAWKRPELVTYSVRKKATEVVAVFPNYAEIDFGGGEGNLSFDDRRIALFGRTGYDWDLFVYDLQLKRVLGRLALHSEKVGGTSPVDNATMSPTGKYVVLGFRERGNGARQGVVLLDEQLNYLRHLSSRGGSHFDICLSEGQEYWVGTDDFSSSLVSVSLADARKRTIVSSIDLSYNIHISCRDTVGEGRVYISEYFAHGDRKVADDRRLGIAKLQSENVRWITSTRSSESTEYRRNPMVVADRSGHRLLWASDWGKPDGLVFTYVLELH